MNESNVNKVEFKLYPRRWLILAIYLLYSGANSFQWMEYSIITNIITKYYNVSPLTVDWTSIIYMILYPMMVVPVSYFVQVKGLRFAAILGCLGTTLAALIKLFSLSQERFYLILCAQTFGSAAQVFILCLPSKLASTWFHMKDVATICSMGFFGTQMGFGMGFVVPSNVVRNEDADDIKRHLNILNWCLAVFMTVVMLGVIFCFKSEPEFAPSMEQHAFLQESKREMEKLRFKSFLQSFLKLLRQKSFFLHTCAYGINVGVYSTICTFLNQFVLQYFKDAEEDAGCMGLTMILCGAFGSILFGYLLDKTRSYKGITTMIYVASCISVFGLIYAVKTRQLLIVYGSLATIGLFMTSYMPIGFETAIELTYPNEESTSTGIMMANTQLMGVVFTLLAGKLNLELGADWTICCLGMLLVLGTIITSAIPNETRRQNALKVG